MTRSIRYGMGLALALVIGWSGVAAAERWEVDPLHSSVVFRVKHLGVAFVHGRFNTFEGEVQFAPEAPEKDAHAKLTVETASVDTAVAARDEHLRAADFFDVEQHPTMTFESTGWKKKRGGYELTGNFTLLGVTKEIRIPVDALGTVDGMQGERRAGFNTTFTIQRSDFGMATSLGPVADDVEITIALSCIQAADEAAPEATVEE